MSRDLLAFFFNYYHDHCKASKIFLNDFLTKFYLVITIFIDNPVVIQLGGSCDVEGCDRIHPRVGTGEILWAAGGGNWEETNEEGGK